MRSVARIGITLLIFCIAACGSSEKKPDLPLVAPDNEQVTMPERPRAENWIEFFTGAQESSRFYVDTTSVSVMPWGEVRYTLRIVPVAVSESVRFEGLMCKTREWRLLAFLRSDGSWSLARDPKWLAIHATSANNQHHALQREYLCEFDAPRKVEAIVRALKNPVDKHSTGR